MRCEHCHRDFDNGLSACPHCGAPKHYAGKTELYKAALRSKLAIKELLSDTFKSHSVSAMEKLLTIGTAQTTSPPDKMILEWDKPWLYFRVFAVGLIFTALAVILTMEGVRAGRTLLSSLPVFIMPLTVLTFFWEMNIPRNISILKVFMIFLMGGMLSILVLPYLGHFQLPATEYAAFTEEPAKLLVTALFVYFINPRYIFNGLLIGAAVGAGFGAFESFDYVMYDDNPIGQMLYRSVKIFGSHLMWAAIEGGALVMVKEKSPLKISHFVDPNFLPYLAIPMSLHFINNHDVEIGIEVPFFGDLKRLLICGVALYTVSILINKAIVQILTDAIDDSPSPPQPTTTTMTIRIKALSGSLKGQEWILQKGQELTVGRFECNIKIPKNETLVSREHCKITLHDDGVYIKDGSKHGTFLQNGQRLQPNTWVKVTGNFYLASPDNMFSIGH